MAGSGLISIGSHTTSHVILTRCAPEAVRKELSLSRQIIEQETGQVCRMFCYPNGTSGDFDSHTREQLREMDYHCGLTSVAGLNDENSDVLELKRFGAPQDLAEFALTVSGFRLLLSRVKGFLPGSKPLRMLRLIPHASGGR